MAKSRFVLDKSFGRHLNHPTQKTSLRPLGDTLRQVSDDVAESAKGMILQQYLAAQAKTQAIKSGQLDANDSRPGQGYLRAKAEEFALKSALDSTIAYMTGDGTSMVGRVTINRTGATSLEFGGEDSGVVLGQGSKERPNHPAYAFLRRALDRA